MTNESPFIDCINVKLSSAGDYLTELNNNSKNSSYLMDIDNVIKHHKTYHECSYNGYRSNNIVKITVIILGYVVADNESTFFSFAFLYLAKTLLPDSCHLLLSYFLCQ